MLILALCANCHLAFSMPRAEDRAFNGALVSITRFSYFTTAPLDWRLSFLPTFKPHSEIPSAIFINNDLPFRGGLQGCQGNLSASPIYNRGIHVDSTRACRTVHSSALVVTRS